MRTSKKKTNPFFMEFHNEDHDFPFFSRRAVSLFGLSNLTQVAKEAYLAHKRLKASAEEAGDDEPQTG